MVFFFLLKYLFHLKSQEFSMIRIWNGRWDMSKLQKKISCFKFHLSIAKDNIRNWHDLKLIRHGCSFRFRYKNFYHFRIVKSPSKETAPNRERKFNTPTHWSLNYRPRAPEIVFNSSIFCFSFFQISRYLFFDSTKFKSHFIALFLKED